MSLKAKIEAVIYASEEPVTLPQLTGLLGQEAQAALDALDAQQGLLGLLPLADLNTPGEPEAGDLDALNAETIGTDPISRESTPDEPVAEAQAPSEDAEAETPSLPSDPTPAQLRLRDRRLREYMRSLLDELIADYAKGDRGVEIREIAGGFRFATKPEYHDAVRGFVRSLKPPLKLSLQALETLAVVAYKQPVTAPEVSEIRGVDSGGVMGSLIARKLVATAGRKQVIGRPILYKTTKEFLLRFGLKDVNELPSIEEFERLASDINDAVQEEIPMPQETEVPTATAAQAGGLSTAEVERDVDPNRNIHEAQADGDPGENTGEEASEEHLTPAPSGPGEFTGDAVVPSADNVAIDGRVAGVPPMYDEPNDELLDSPQHDADVQSAEAKGE